MSEKQIDRLLGCLAGIFLAIFTFATIGYLDAKGLLDPLLDFLHIQ